MDMTIDQQVALDEALVAHASRLRIGKGKFHLKSDISSKESTLQLVYDVLNVDFTYLMSEDFVYRVEHKDAKKSNEMYYPRKRLSTSTKGKQPAKASKAKSLTVLSEVAMTEAEQLKLATKRILQQTHIFQAIGSSADEGTGSIPGVPDVPTEESDEEISWKSSDEEEDDDVDEKSDDQDDDAQDDDDDQDDENKNDDDQDERDDDDDQEEASDDEQYSDEEVKVAVQIQSDRLRDEAQAENEECLKNLDENIQKFIKEQVKEHVKVQVSKILSKIEQIMNEQLEDEVLTRSSNSSKTSYAVAADLSEMDLKKILIEKMEGNKSIYRSNEQRNLYKALVKAYEFDKIILYTYGDTVALKRRRDDDADKDEEPSAGSDRGSKRRREGKELQSASAPKEKATRTTGKSTQGSIQPYMSELAKQTDSRSSFNELMDTPVEFSAFLMNRLKVDTLTTELLVGPTYKLMKGSCKSLVELEFFLEEVYKAMTDQLDWIKPEGQQYPHNLLKPLPLIPNSQGHCVVPFDHFINNDNEYLRGGALSRKYITSVTKTKAADYGHIKWIEYLFYGFAVNRESAHDVYSKRRIIAVTELKIVEWHNYKHLDWITVRRDDEKLYKFKEGDFKRLRIQDIEDMLLLLVQGKLTNLTVEERFAFNVSLRMFTRSILIQRHVEDLQLGVESYQKKLKLTRPDTYRSDLKRKEAYTAYSNPRGFIYQNKDKQIRLMRIDELHKFSDGTLTDDRTTLDDRLKGIRMKYLP
nr:hypothetical protein [Tanacetum cinerariifolium]